MNPMPNRPHGEDLSFRIPGWGSDLDPARRPGVPREKAPPEPPGTGAYWSTPESQVARVRVFHTREREGLTPVFGTSCPPRWLSGWMRARAYDINENRLSHWMLLLAADRVDLGETVLSDVIRNRWQNPLRETGVRTEFEKGGRLEGERSQWALGAASVLLLGVTSLAVRRRSTGRAALLSVSKQFIDTFTASLRAWAFRARSDRRIPPPWLHTDHRRPKTEAC